MENGEKGKSEMLQGKREGTEEKSKTGRVWKGKMGRKKKKKVENERKREGGGREGYTKEKKGTGW